MKKIIFLILLALSLESWSKSLPGLVTIAEKSGWIQTGRADETARLCRDFSQTYPQRVTCKIYGKTPEGRELHALIVEDKGSNKIKSPVIWVQAGIHAGEIDGKDAVFLLLREILEKKITPDPLEGLKFIFIPIVNLDGHERVGKWNRPNQIGPEEMGWRTTAQNYNLNRDFTKIDSLELRAMNRYWGEVNPVLSLDLHVTDGAQFQPEVGIVTTPTTHHGSTALHQAGKALEVALIDKLIGQGTMALPFYPTFEDEENPLSGFTRYVSTPRFSQGYWFNRNRIGMLVETHSWKNYATRVKIHHDTVLAVLELAQKNAKDWMLATQELDKTNLSGKEVDLEYKHSDKFTTIDFPGYKFTIEKSSISGGKYIQYDPSMKEIWKVPLFEELVPSLTVQAPQKGYFVPPSEAKWVKEKLQVHGIKSLHWSKASPKGLQVFRATKTDLSPGSYEGHQTLTVQGKWTPEPTDLPKGTLFIPINQPGGRLVLQIFEPQAKDSLLAWGFFNIAFEQKEYMESYVIEAVAKDMIKDPKIKEEFNALNGSDPFFAKSPEKKLEFFYKKHPSWDIRFNRYPVFKK